MSKNNDCIIVRYLPSDFPDYVGELVKGSYVDVHTFSDDTQQIVGSEIKLTKLVEAMLNE